MKRLLVKLLVIAVVGLVLLGVAGAFLFGPAARTAVEKGARYGLGVDAELGHVGAGLGASESSLTIGQLEVRNPAGIEGDPFLRVGELSVGVGTFSVLSSTVKVPSIDLDGLQLTLIQDGTRSNFKEILDHARALASSPDSPPPGAKDEAGGEAAAGPQLLVGDVRLRGIELSAAVRGIPGVDLEKTLKVPDFELNVADAAAELARKRGLAGEALEEARSVSVAELTGILADALVQRGLEAAEGHLPPQAVAVLRDGLPGLEDRAQDLIDDLKDRVEDEKDQLQDRLEDELKKGKDGLQEKLGDILPGGQTGGQTGGAASGATEGAQSEVDAAKDKVDAAVDEVKKQVGGGLDDLLKKKSKKKDGDG